MIKIISRKSDLAVIQAELVAEALKKTDRNISISFVKKETEGDIDQLTSLSKLSNIGVFTNDIRESLLNNEADIAVHSLKDLPIDDQTDTSIVSILERADSRDILFLKKDNLDNYSNKELKILTSSPRRVYNFSNFLKPLLPFNPSKITFEDIRGNIPTRLKLLPKPQLTD
jgi:hydroxymethylbilane synthase